MRAPSRLPALIVAASLAAAGLWLPAAALAQGTAAPTSTAVQSVPAPQLSPTTPDPSAVPQLSPGTTSTGATTPARPHARRTPKPARKAAARPRPSALPNTGIDGRILAGLGVGMLLCGVGLRLRTARERF